MRKAALFLVVFLAVTFSAFGQAERLTTKDAMGVELNAGRSINETSTTLAGVHIGDVSGPEGLSEHTRLVSNDVNFTARHCKDYVRRGFFKKILGIPGKVDDQACAADPSTVYYSETHHNLRTNAGGDWQASVMGNTSTVPATCTYIALSNDATAPSTSDTSVASEIATNGLSRSQATYAHTNGTASYTEQKVFSATGTQASQKAGLLNAPSSGTLCFENTYTQVTV